MEQAQGSRRTRTRSGAQLASAIDALSPAAPVEVAGPDAAVRSRRLLLRPLRVSDRAAFIGAIRESRSEIARWFPLNRPGECDGAYFERQLDLTVHGCTDGTSRRRAALLEDGTFVGMFNIISIERGLEPAAEANWWVRTALCGRGYGLEGVRAVVEHALAAPPLGLGLVHVRAGIAPGNERCRRLAEGAGFVHRPGAEEFLEFNGRWVRHDRFVRTASW